MIHDRYFYQIADAETKKRIRILYEGLDDFRKEIRIPGVLTPDEITALMEGVRADNPGFFHFGHGYRYGTNVIYNETVILPEYICTKKEAAGYIRLIRQRMDLLHAGLKLGTPGMSDYEKVRRVHDAMVRWFTYDHASLSLGIDTDHFHAAHSILGVFGKRTAVCEGLSLAIKLFLNRANVPCIVVSGHGGTDGDPGEVNHAWNMVRLNGKPCQMDVTWDINASGDGKYPSYTYFLLTDAEMRLSHPTWDVKIPCRSPEENYFYRNGLYFRTEREAVSRIRSALSHGEKAMSFRIGWRTPNLQKEAADLLGKCLDFTSSATFTMDEGLQVVSFRIGS